MAKVSRDSADHIEEGPVYVDRSTTVGGYTINFVTINEDVDLAPMFTSLPGGHCSCPHWGYLVAGKMVVRYGDREETYEPGDAFFMTAGHVPKAFAGTEFVQFSPAEELKVTEEAIAAGMSAR